MKKYVLGLMIAISFMACSKHEEERDRNCIDLKAEFFKNANLAIGSITVTQTAGVATINYNTLYEKNITKLELMGGETSNSLCTINTQNITGNSLQTKNYTVATTLTTNGAYYMFKYTLVNGDWGYTGLYKF
jgi:hypothetical protein